LLSFFSNAHHSQNAYFYIDKFKSKYLINYYKNDENILINP
jgi:hypothetical protein